MSVVHIRGIGLAVGALLGATLVVGCNGGSNLPETTRSPSLPSASRTGSVPSESEPAAENTRTAAPAPSKSNTRTDSRPPTESESESESAEPTVTATATQTVTSTRSATRTATPSQSASTPSPSATPTTSPTPTASESESSGSLWWVWLLLAAIAVGAIVWFLAVARHRKWDAAFALALTEARWEADSLAPSLLDPSVSGGVLAERWRGSQRRLDEMQTELTRLADSAAGTQRSARIGRVSGAAAALRQALASDVALRSGTNLPTASEADLAQSGSLAQNRSDALLAAVDDRPDPTEPPATGGAPTGKHER